MALQKKKKKKEKKEKSFKEKISFGWLVGFN